MLLCFVVDQAMRWCLVRSRVEYTHPVSSGRVRTARQRRPQPVRAEGVP